MSTPTPPPPPPPPAPLPASNPKPVQRHTAAANAGGVELGHAHNTHWAGKTALLLLTLLTALYHVDALAWGIIILGLMSDWDLGFAWEMIADGFWLAIYRLAQIVFGFLLVALGVLVAALVAARARTRRPPTALVALYVALSVVWWLVHTAMSLRQTFGGW